MFNISIETVWKIQCNYHSINNIADKHLAGSNSKQTSHVLNIKIVGVSRQLQEIERYC